jgi:hypothetical protein
VTLADDDGAPRGGVADADRAAPDGGQRAVAALLREPPGPADGRGAVAALRAKAPLAVAPQPRDDLLRRLAGREPACARGARRALLGQRRALQLDVGDRALGAPLADLEASLEEVGALGRRAAVVARGRRRRQRDATVARVQQRAERDDLGALQRDEGARGLRRARPAARAAAGREADQHHAADDLRDDGRRERRADGRVGRVLGVRDPVGVTVADRWRWRWRWRWRRRRRWRH